MERGGCYTRKRTHDDKKQGGAEPVQNVLGGGPATGLAKIPGDVGNRAQVEDAKRKTGKFGTSKSKRTDGWEGGNWDSLKAKGGGGRISRIPHRPGKARTDGKNRGIV